MCRPQLEDPSIPQRAICPNCRAHASSARCPSPETRKCSAASNPAAWINDRSGQRPLMRIDPDHVASVIGREQQVRRSGTALLRCSIACPPGVMLVKGGSADNLPVGALTRGERSYQARPILEDKNRGRHFVAKTPTPGVRVLLSQTSVQPSTLREPSPARAPKIQHRECFAAKAVARTRRPERVQRRRQGASRRRKERNDRSLLDLYD